MPTISVIVPVYKVEKYLDRCVESIVNQTYTDFELILVDDGSPDNCPAMCNEWAKRDKRICVIHKENGGLSSARNAGMDMMQGKYVCFIDSDDWIELNYLESLVALLAKYPEAEIAACESIQDKGNGNEIVQTIEKVKVYSKKEMLDYFFRVNGEPSNTGVWNKLIKTDILSGFRYVITLNEDVEASYEFYTRANYMVETNQILYHYFVNDSGITRSKFSIKDLDYLKVWDRIVGRTEQEHPEYLEYAVLGRKRANFTMLSKMLLRGYDKQDQMLNEVRKKLKAEVREDYFKLVKWKMPLSRKVLLTLEIL